MALSLELIESDGTTELHLRGELDMSSARSMLDAGTEMLVQHHADPMVVMDLTQLRFCDSAGLRVLLQIQRDASALDRVVVLRSPQAHMRRLLEGAGLADAFTVIPFADALELQSTATARV